VVDCDLIASILNPNRIFFATLTSKLKSLANSYWFLTNLPGQWLANGALQAITLGAREDRKDKRQPEGVMGKTVRSVDRKGPGLAADLADLVRNLARSLFDPYRPELHYMRGPGPKWHAKHDQVAYPAYNAVSALVPVRVRVKR
jgi:hypothetical protein